MDLDRLQRILGNPDPQRREGWEQIAERLGKDPSKILGRLIPRAIIDDRDSYAAKYADPVVVDKLKLAALAIQKLAASANALLTAAELEALIALAKIAGRPAMPVSGGKFAAPPPQWGFLCDNADVIESRIAGVGRIDEPAGTHLGTGFLVGPTVVMTNRHVAVALLDANEKWRAELSPVIDFDRELGDGSRPFALTGLVYLPDDDEIDLALLRVANRDAAGKPLPAHLALQPTAPRTVEDHLVYAIGYPGREKSGLVDEDVMKTIFGLDLSVKRLQPGLLNKLDPDNENLFLHDCSTLGGSSGSCLIDYETGLVCGLHFGGRNNEYNYAVALWLLAKELPGEIEIG